MTIETRFEDLVENKGLLVEVFPALAHSRGTIESFEYKVIKDLAPMTCSLLKTTYSFASWALAYKLGTQLDSQQLEFRTRYG